MLGEYVGACPIYGYRRSADNNNQLEIDEYPASIVRDIFRMKIDGMSALRISELLNALGVLSPMEYKRDRGLPHPKKGFADKPDAKWSATAIFRILKDETYTGTLIQGKTGTHNYKIKDVINKPESEWNRVENTHKAIVSKQNFDLVKRILKLDTRTAPGGESVYLFSGVLICGCCGGRMTRKINRYRGKEYLYYYCPTGKRNGCTGAAMLREDELTECVLESAKAHISGVASLELVLAADDCQKATLALVKQYQAQIDELEGQLVKVIRFKTGLYQSMVDGLIDKDEQKALKSKYEKDEKHLRNAIASLESERDGANEGRNQRLVWMEHFHKFEQLSELDRRAVVNLIQSIRVKSKTELDITFAYQDDFEQELKLLMCEEVA